MFFIKKLETAIIISLLISILFSIFSFAETSDEIRGEILRLHVIANSNSVSDQNLKLAVRDAVLDKGAEIFDGSVNIKNASEKILPKLDLLTQTAKSVISSRGYDYDVKISLSNEYFTTRTYENITLPAGKYLALRIVIGEGEGKNWWCVMFPPMCLSAANEADVLKGVLNDNELNLLQKNPKFEPRFKIIEIYESIKYKFSNVNNYS